ncbi:glutathione S-transferase family protein [Pendulispora rubella]|uniref:Glutathione S-transferase family protein n=1 Tax=Pendulispora rubella TaxID=2741070 RepID=A0ABZ2L521_9BACT
MALTVYLHPLASFCQKVLIALYENEIPFESRTVDLMDQADAAHYKNMWPVGKMPLLRDDARDRTVPETSIIIEYLARHYPGRTPLLPADPDLALQTRLWDRFYDLYVQDPMQKIVVDRIRPPGTSDAHGVAEAKGKLQIAYGMIEEQMATRTWAIGEDFTMADCAAAPALFYAELVAPFGDAHPKTAAYLERLRKRPSFARVVEEAKPYFHMFPRG